MPTLPVRLASASERWFARPATVDAVADLSPGLRRVAFTVPALADREWTRGQEVEFRVGERDFRHYTPAAVDPAAGRIEIVFVRHGDGPGAAWAEGLRDGDEVGVLGPGGGVRRTPGTRELFLGDGTALGLFAALAPTAGSVSGAVEVPEADRAAAAGAVPGLAVLAAGPEPGAALAAWLREHLAVAERPERACLAGHVGTLTALRRDLREAGLPRGAIATKAHWATGRRGL